MKKEKRAKYLFKNTAIFAIGNFATKFISFFLVPLYTNILSTSEYGTIDLLTVLVTVLVPIITLNISDAVMRFPLDKNANEDKIINIGNIILLMSIILTMVMYPILKLFKETSDYAIYFCLYIITFCFSQLYLSNLRGQEKLGLYSIGNIMHSLLIAVLNITFLVHLKRGISGYFTAYIISNIITALYAFYVGRVFKSIKKFKIDKKLMKQMIVYSSVLIPNSLMWWIMNSLDRVMISSMIGASANGIYAVSYKIPTLLSTLATIFNQAWSYSAIKEEESKDKNEYSDKIYNSLVSISITIAIGLLLIIKPFLKIYVGSEFYEAWKYTPYLIIGFVFMTLGSFLATSYTVHKDSWGFLKSASCGAIINFVLNYFLIKRIGIAGAALATCISYIIVYIYRAIDTKKYIRLNILKKEHILGYIIMIITAFTLCIEGFIGEIFLIIEFLIVLCLYRDLWKNIIKGIIYKLKGTTYGKKVK